jgi:hypothetical protein
MSIDATSNADNNPFRSRLLRATLEEIHHNSSQSVALSQQSSVPSKAAENTPHFELSTSQLIKLVSRYRMDKLNFETLQSMPMADLKPEEREFVKFLRNNRDIFDRIARLDKDPETLSADDIKIAAQFAGDSLTLSSEDLAYLREVTDRRTEAGQEAQRNRRELDTAQTENLRLDNSTAQRQVENRRLPPTTQQLEVLLRRLSEVARPVDNTATFNQPVVQPQRLLTFTELLHVPTEGLTENEQAHLAFLRSSPVSSILQQIVASNQNVITVDVIRILSSLLFNPAIQGGMPIVFFKNSPRDPKSLFDSESEEMLEASPSVEEHMSSMLRINRNGKPEYHLQAADILAICHRISDDGTVSLANLRKYKPRNRKEAQTMRLLGQSSIFHRLSSLDHHEETLSDEDIRLAVAEKALVFSDAAMVLVVLP